MKPKILVVDDTVEKRDFYIDVLRKFLGSDWQLLLPDATSSKTLVDSAQTLILENADLAIAVIDAYLEKPEEPKPKGLPLLMFVKEHTADCYKILVSTYIQTQDELPPNPPVDDFVYTRFVGGRSPVDALQEALRRGRKRYESLLQKSLLLTTK